MPERDLDELHRTLLRYIRSAGHGRWRIPQDVVDQAYDKAVDKLLEPDANPRIYWLTRPGSPSTWSKVGPNAPS